MTTIPHPLPAFVGLSALPETKQVPEGALYTFRFSNGYGAHVMRAPNLTFELVALCLREPQGLPIYDLLEFSDVIMDLSIEATCALLRRLEAMPRNPHLRDALLHEEF